MACQVADPAAAEFDLECTAQDSAGFRCEKRGPHTNDQHWVSRHTVLHSLMGNGYVCDEVTC